MPATIAPLDIHLRVDIAEIAPMMRRLEHFAQANGLSEMAAFRLQLVVEELVKNLVDHAYPDGRPGRASVRVERVEDCVLVEVRDDAPLFDPFAVPPPDVESDLDHRPIGGLGIHLVRSMTDRAVHSVVDGRNCVRLVLPLHGGP